MAQTGENIYKRSDVPFRARNIAERDANGKTIYKSVHGSSKDEVREAARVEVYAEKAPPLRQNLQRYR